MKTRDLKNNKTIPPAYFDVSSDSSECCVVTSRELWRASAFALRFARFRSRELNPDCNPISCSFSAACTVPTVCKRRTVTIWHHVTRSLVSIPMVMPVREQQIHAWPSLHQRSSLTQAVPNSRQHPDRVVWIASASAAPKSRDRPHLKITLE